MKSLILVLSLFVFVSFTCKSGPVSSPDSIKKINITAKNYVDTDTVFHFSPAIFMECLELNFIHVAYAMPDTVKSKSKVSMERYCRKARDNIRCC